MAIFRESTDTSLVSQHQKHDRRLMLFDLKVTGHHASYIRHLVQYWCKYKLPGSLIILVSPEFIRRHEAVVRLADVSETVQFVAISDEETAELPATQSGFDRALHNLKEWQVLCKYAAKLQITHCMILYLDTCELPLLLGLTPPCKISGIYFRPTFHYNDFPGQTFTLKDRLQQWRDRIFIYRTLRNPQLKTLFCLDPFASKQINRIYKTTKALTLPDPVEIPSQVEILPEDLKAKLKIQPDRKIFLLFGSLDERKGIYKVLDALLLLSPEQCQQICLFLVGRANPTEEALINACITEVCQKQPVQIITELEFVSEQAMQAYFHLADVILALYQRHVGMSGVLLQAAAAKKPVLSSNYGLMGELVRRYKLGLALDATSTNEIAQGFTQFLDNSTIIPYDKENVRAFAEQNIAEKFADVVFQHL